MLLSVSTTHKRYGAMALMMLLVVYWVVSPSHPLVLLVRHLLDGHVVHAPSPKLGTGGKAVQPEEAAEKDFPCTVHNPYTNAFIDLRELGVLGKNGVVTAWSAKGHDYGRNFTLGVCSSPFHETLEVQDVADLLLVGGYYVDEKGKRFLIGDFSTQPQFRGRKLTLTYENGSLCGTSGLRKQTVLLFTCDRNTMHKAVVQFVGQVHECAYYFEVRTAHACPTVDTEDNWSVMWVFAVIIMLAVGVVFGAGLLYKVMVARGVAPSTRRVAERVKEALGGDAKRTKGKPAEV